MQQITITSENEGQRFNKFLGKYFDAAPQSFLYKMLRKKNIKRNHGKASGNEILQSGDVIEIYMTDETIAKFRKDGTVPVFDTKTSKIEPVSRSLEKHNPFDGIEVIYEDQDVLILNKPVGILSQKATADDYSLNERIVEYYQMKEKRDSLFTPSVCNRLDRNTSGMILAGMSLKGSRVLSHMLKERLLDKYYLTIVSGRVEKPSVIKGFLSKKQSHNQVLIYKTFDEAEKNGIEKPAYIETKYEPLAYGKWQQMEFTLLKVKLVTGKTHQIRAHLDSIGHSIIGDGKYGLKSVNTILKKEFGLRHQLLHAYELSFPKNCEKEELNELQGKVFYAPLPEEFLFMLNNLFGKETVSRFCKSASE